MSRTLLDNASSLRRRPWQVSIRSLLVGTTLIAILCAWICYEREKIAVKRAAISEIARLGGNVSTWSTRWSWIQELLGDDQAGEVNGMVLGSDDVAQQLAALESITGNRRWEVYESFDDGPVAGWLGDAGPVLQIEVHPVIDDEVLRQLADFDQIRSLELCGTQVTDAGLASVARLPRLEYLRLTGSNISDRGLAKLRGLKCLKTLLVDNCPNVTDVGMQELAQIGPIENLHIGPSITAASIPPLAALPALKELTLSNVRMTRTELQLFFELKKGVGVEYDFEPTAPDGSTQP